MGDDRLRELQDRLQGAIDEGGGSGLEFNPAGRRSSSSSTSTKSESDSDTEAPDVAADLDTLDAEDVIPLVVFVDEYVSAKFGVTEADGEDLEKFSRALVAVLEKYGLAYVGEFSPEIALLLATVSIVGGKVAEYRVLNAEEKEPISIETKPLGNEGE